MKIFNLVKKFKFDILLLFILLIFSCLISNYYYKLSQPTVNGEITKIIPESKKIKVLYTYNIFGKEYTKQIMLNDNIFYHNYLNSINTLKNENKKLQVFVNKKKL